MPIRRVIDGERLHGHGNASVGFPEIVVLDGQGLGGGARVCSIQGFHWLHVTVRSRATELCFENKLSLVVDGGIVEYATPETRTSGRPALVKRTAKPKG
jgi:hypothetical protein